MAYRRFLKGAVTMRCRLGCSSSKSAVTRFALSFSTSSESSLIPAVVRLRLAELLDGADGILEGDGACIEAATPEVGAGPSRSIERGMEVGVDMVVSVWGMVRCVLVV